MVIIFILWVIGLFFLEIFLTLRYGSDHPVLPKLAFYFLGVAAIFLEYKTNISEAVVWIILILFAQSLGGKIAFYNFRKRAGSLILTYKRNVGSLIGVIARSGFYLLIGYLSIIPSSYMNGLPVYDDVFFRTELPLGVCLILMALLEIPTIFRKGELFENGIATPDVQYFPWNGYSSYKWVDNTKKKTAELFSLSLEGKRNWDFTIHGFSSSKKDILDSELSNKLKNRSSTGKNQIAIIS